MKINFRGFFKTLFMVSKVLFFSCSRVNSMQFYTSDKFSLKRNMKVLSFKNHYLPRLFIWYSSCLICKAISVIHKTLSDTNRAQLFSLLMYTNVNLVWLDSFGLVLRFLFSLKQNLRLATQFNTSVLSSYVTDVTFIED